MSEHSHTKSDPRIFVFGSNELGLHGGGAARYAFDELQAHWGKGEGLQGRSYALPTCSWPGKPLPLSKVRKYVSRFIAFAQSRPDLTFFVSEVGCGLSGFQASEIMPLFSDAPENCDLPPGWRD